MSVDGELAPVLTCRFVGGTAEIPGIVDDLIHLGGLASAPRAPGPEALKVLGLALQEVLHTITAFCGQQTEGDASSVEIWVERTLSIVCVRFRGAALPGWLVANWDRSQDPAVLAPASDCGWGWLVVREALDAVSHEWCGSEQLLFLEKRL